MQTILAEIEMESVGPISLTMPKPEDIRGPTRWDNAPVMKRFMDHESGNLGETAYLPATTLRGILRRAVVLKRMEAAAERGEPYSLDQTYEEQIGQNARSEMAGADIDPMALRAYRESNPVVDLFGSGMAAMSRLKCSMLMPKYNVLPEPMTGVRKDIHDLENPAFDLMSKSAQGDQQRRVIANNKRANAESLKAKLESKLRGLERSKSATTKDGQTADDLEAQIDEATRLVEKYEAKMGGMKNSSRTLLKWYVLPAGVLWRGRMVIVRGKPIDLELLTGAFDAFSQYPMIGGQQARGCGEVRGKVTFRIGGHVEREITFGGFEPARIEIFDGAPSLNVA